MPLYFIRVRWRLGLNFLRVTLCEWLILRPLFVFFPQIIQLLPIFFSFLSIKKIHKSSVLSTFQKKEFGVLTQLLFLEVFPSSILFGHRESYKGMFEILFCYLINIFRTNFFNFFFKFFQKIITQSIKFILDRKMQLLPVCL